MSAYKTIKTEQFNFQMTHKLM